MLDSLKTLVTHLKRALPSAKRLCNISVYLTTKSFCACLNEGLLASSSFPFQTFQPCKEKINVLFTLKAHHLDAAQNVPHRRRVLKCQVSVWPLFHQAVIQFITPTGPLAT